MPTKATSKSAPQPSPKAPASTRARSKPARASDEPAAPVAPPKPAEPRETLSLIDEKVPQKKVRQPRTASSVLPPISRIRAQEKGEPAEVRPISQTEATAKAEEPAAEPVAELPVQPPAAAIEVEKPVEPPVEEKVEEEAVPANVIHLKPPIIVRDLATALGLKPFQLIGDLMSLGIFTSVNSTIEPQQAEALCEKHGFVFEVERRKKEQGVHKPEPVVEPPPRPPEPPKDEMQSRPPIITFMGHVDHGKTSLLDAIRKSRVVSGEAGGITQHIGAYSVDHKGQRITFLDTPGHAAFTAMRARGAKVTDIVVLVVAADDGLMPQTIEAISHAKAAGVSIMVAINKIDLPGANPEKVKGQLQEKDLTPEEWGGQTLVVEVSATKGTGVDTLLESILLQAEIMELKASEDVAARGVVIEAQMEPGRGPTATIIVQMGTLQIGNAFICGSYWGKVKSLIGDSGKPVKTAGPATPVKVLGFSGLPNAGEEFLVMDDERSARALSDERLMTLRGEKLTMPARATLESILQQTAPGQAKVLQLILKSDVQGSCEALVHALNEIETKKVDLKFLHNGVGPITESDILLATASNAVVIGFNVKVESSAAAIAKREGVQVKLFSIIYELIDQVKEAMSGLLDPESRESVIGHAQVKQVFELSKGKVAGCYVSDGRIARNGRARVLRDRQPIYDGGIATLRRFQDEVKEVRSGMECGLKLGDYTEYEAGDIIECYLLEKVAQKL